MTVAGSTTALCSAPLPGRALPTNLTRERAEQALAVLSLAILDSDSPKLCAQYRRAQDAWLEAWVQLSGQHHQRREQ